MAAGIIAELLRSEEPSVRWATRTRALGEPPDDREVRRLREEIRRSPRVRRMLAHRDAAGRLPSRRGVYAKWQGAHWVLAALADLGYPPGDESLLPLRDQVLDQWLAEHYQREYDATGRASTYGRPAVPVIHGRHRRCASQQGNALRALTTLGLADDRCADLAALLLRWQWPDGGWNCDKKPDADTSSFCETLTPMRGLAAHAAATGDTTSGAAARRAAEVFLTRRLAFGRRDGRLIHPEFTLLHYPLYWHYDVLGGLVGMVAAGTIADPRCADALDLLAAARLPDGGWPAHRRYYRVSETEGSGAEYVDWGGASSRRANPWVTVDALAVLRAAGR
jgi:hypothetical protein